jgi:hypothetical protein
MVNQRPNQTQVDHQLVIVQRISHGVDSISTQERLSTEYSAVGQRRFCVSAAE